MANISITDATRDKLISLKEIDRETYEDVILRLIKISENIAEKKNERPKLVLAVGGPEKKP